MVGLTMGFQFLGWFFAHLVVNLIHWVLLLKRKNIMDYYCACVAQRKTHHGASVERELFNSKLVLLAIWTIFGGIIPVATVTIHNITKPGFSIYFSSLFYSDDPSMGHVLQTFCVVLTVLLQCFTLFHGFFASLMSDVIPMFIASSQFAIFKSVNQGLIRLKECKEACRALSVKGKTSTLSPIVLAMVDEDSLNSSEERDCEVERSEALRNAIDVHLRAQNCVQIFNQAFGPLLVIFIVQVFIMICVLFFTIVKTPLTTAVDALVFFGNGTQYFIRALIGLYIFGRVQDTAMQTKQILLLQLQVQREMCLETPGLATELDLFVSTLSDICISAGGYIYFSKGFLLSFYGILATYLAVLLQTLY